MKLIRLGAAVLSLLFTASVTLADCLDCTTVDFDKQIQLHLLTPMLNMNLQQKITYLQSQGIDVFRVEDTEKLPVTVPYLPYATEDIIPKKFLKVFSEGAIGLYMTESNYAYGVKNPTILLIESTDDWTVIHEYAHYLFDRARMMTDNTRESLHLMHTEDAQEDFFEAKEIYRNWGQYRDDDHKRRTIQSFVLYAKMQLFFERSASLEETTIEKLLRKYHVTHKPHGFGHKDIERSDRYVFSTSQKAQESLRLILEDCVDLAKTLNAQDKDLLKELSVVCSQADLLKKDAVRVYESTGLKKPLEESN
ncbi:hypothetical protein EZJ49_05635 [Bdellovibrio bacteriovorus]|uniref:hypothetical protein n=1 Tax=Bdellovibrio bacteriovorus TaxID=959 RepID=UPI0021D3586B|nr:hypothetical protein [Bdellovibrio bacteriovorus]UXR65728.1 hypothetical protein EZJ49_05635 [Bdellovibrio bacteriovorus]